jgi:hypothetical protein
MRSDPSWHHFTNVSVPKCFRNVVRVAIAHAGRLPAQEPAHGIAWLGDPGLRPLDQQTETRGDDEQHRSHGLAVYPWSVGGTAKPGALVHARFADAFAAQTR